MRRSICCRSATIRPSSSTSRSRDSLGRSETTTLTFNITGGSDAPVITSTNALGSVTEDAGPTVAVNGGFETGDLTGYSSSSVSVDSAVYRRRVRQLFGEALRLRLPRAGCHDGRRTALHRELLCGRRCRRQRQLAPGVTGMAPRFSPRPMWRRDSPNTPSIWWATHWIRRRSCSSISPPTAPGFWSTRFRSRRRPVRRSRRPAEASPSPTSRRPIPTPRASRRDGSGYVGTFSLDPVSESGGSGSLAWHYSVDNADIQFLAQGQTLVQTYTVMVTDDHGAATPQDVTIAIDGTNDAPTAVNDTIITDAGPNGTVIIAPWALAANDTDPDTIDQLSANSIGTSTGGSAGGAFGFVFFTDDATLGGSFTYDATDGTRPAAILPPRPSSTTPPRPRRSPAPAPTKSSSPPRATRRSTAAAATTSCSASTAITC